MEAAPGAGKGSMGQLPLSVQDADQEPSPFCTNPWTADSISRGYAATLSLFSFIREYAPAECRLARSTGKDRGAPARASSAEQYV